ncbi:Endonuclease/Exonuclease/phosphatase domain containing protein-like protein [Leptotrombidium deliense]|uniref:Endonuclease/Exonuclease/phosphatase domain containing protein-like protein n=1 Tax=Leptotrombidium deliense TaxID=299467 RepID=A0A443SSQ3_9ACAR|nr:Endonuclease/Exonuclease/phosphatase domain containing protein-like protein [Leptotrombidium deliense]
MGLNLGDIKEIVCRLRSWHLTSFGRVYVRNRQANCKPKVEFSLMSYNVLSQDLLNGHSSLYHSCSDRALQWPQRGELIKRELLENIPDVICLQEMHNSHYEDVYLPYLQDMGYTGIYKKRTGDKLDGCAMFIKNSAFSLESSVAVDFNRQDLARFLDRDNVALIAVLNPITTQDNVEWQLVVVTTHLLFNPKRGDIRLAQLRLLFAELHRITSTMKKNVHIIFCGDMNAEPYSPMYRFIRDGKLELYGLRTGDIAGIPGFIGKGRLFQSDDIRLNGINLNSIHESTNNNKVVQPCEASPSRTSKVSHNFNFRSVYPNNDFSGNKFVSTFHEEAASLVDYIFYSCSPQFKLIGYKKLLTCNQMAEIGYLPNEYLGSDHLSLFAKFVINENEPNK